MSRLRISCKAPTSPGPFSLLPSWPDVDLFFVGDDGSESHITNVTKITWIAETSAEPVRALLEFVDVDVDVEVPLRQVFDVVDAAREFARGRDGAVLSLIAAVEALEEKKSRS